MASRIIKIVLTETDTVFLFELASMTAEKGSEDGNRVEKENDQYNLLTKNHHRKIISNEAQTEELILGIKFAETPQIKTESNYAFASTWDMHDSFSAIDDQTSRKKILTVDALTEYPSFSDAVVIAERVLANNVYKPQQEKFKGIFTDIDFTDVKDSLYLCSLDCHEIENIAVTGISLNKSNDDLIAIGYGKYFYADCKRGIVGIWNIKNLIRPERFYQFNSPVTCVEFSKDNPRLLSVGFYNGEVLILDVTAYEKKIIAQSCKNVNPSYKPIWQIQWLYTDSSNDEIITIGEDGRIIHFKCTNSIGFICTQIMRITRPIEMTEENSKLDQSLGYDMPVTRNCSCLILCFHPKRKDIYFVGTKEGYIYKCSINLFHRYIGIFLAHDGPIVAMQFSSANHKIFLTGGADWTVKLWSENMYEPLIVLSLNYSPESVSFSPTHPTIIAAIGNESLFLWDLQNTFNLLLIELKLNHKKLTKLIFSRDGKNLVIGDIDGKVHIYNLHYILNDINDKDCKSLEECIQKSLSVKPELLKKFNKTI